MNRQLDDSLSCDIYARIKQQMTLDLFNTLYSHSDNSIGVALQKDEPK